MHCSQGADRANRSVGFLNWIHDPENRDEVLTLYYVAQRNRRTPSYYAFGLHIPLQSQYEIDAYVTMIGAEHEAELARNAEEEMKSIRK